MAKESSTYHEDRYLSLTVGSEVTSLDPRLGIDNTSAHVVKMLFEGLMWINERGEVENALLDSYTVSEDKKTYLLKLKKSFWSNGMPVTAYDFEYSWKKTIDLNHADRSIGVHYFYIIKNVVCYLREHCSLEDIGIKALDEETLFVELERPVPYFLESLTNTSFFPICSAVDKVSPGWAYKTGDEFVCNGPFFLEEHKYQSEIVVRKNPLYWNAKEVRLPGIKLSLIKDNGTRLTLFEKKQIDWLGKPLSRIPLDAIATLKDHGHIQTASSRGVYWYFVNTEKPPLSNKKMRKAFAYAINRGLIAKYVLQEGERPACSLISSLAGHDNSSYFLDNNTQRAKELFQEALQELHMTREELPPIVLSYNQDDIHQNVAQVIQEQLFNVLGIKIDLQHFDWKTHYQNLVQGNYSLGGISWQPWLKDPIFILQVFRNKRDGINMSRWENAEFRALLDASDEEVDAEKRWQLLQKAEELLMEELPIIPIYFMSMAYAKNPSLQDVTLTELNMVDFRKCHFEDPN